MLTNRRVLSWLDPNLGSAPHAPSDTALCPLCLSFLISCQDCVLSLSLELCEYLLFKKKKKNLFICLQWVLVAVCELLVAVCGI